MKYAAPHAGDCPLCSKPLGSVALFKTRANGWVHKACWMEEHE